jgi:hypothetical protein
MNQTQEQIKAWEMLSRAIFHLIAEPFNGHTEEQAQEIQRTEYLGKNIVIKACNTLDDCRRKIKAEALSQMRKDTDSLQSQLVASDPVLSKRRDEVNATPFAKRLSARK